jgi:hypothetical protein
MYGSLNEKCNKKNGQVGHDGSRRFRVKDFKKIGI